MFELLRSPEHFAILFFSCHSSICHLHPNHILSKMNRSWIISSFIQDIIVLFWSSAFLLLATEYWTIRVAGNGILVNPNFSDSLLWTAFGKIQTRMSGTYSSNQRNNLPEHFYIFLLRPILPRHHHLLVCYSCSIFKIQSIWTAF